METARVQVLNNKASLEVTETVVVKRHYQEEDLLRQKTYFEGMIAKAEAGLKDVNAKLEQITYGKR